MKRVLREEISSYKTSLAMSKHGINVGVWSPAARREGGRERERERERARERERERGSERRAERQEGEKRVRERESE